MRKEKEKKIGKKKRGGRKEKEEKSEEGRVLAAGR